jgi:hypothetical protein
MKTYTLEKLTALLDKHGIKYFDAKDDDYICVKFVESEMNAPLTEVQVDAMNRNKLVQRLSGHFLSEQLPDNWHELSEEELSTFIEANTWEPLEHCNADEIFEVIDVLTRDVEAIIEEVSDE